MTSRKRSKRDSAENLYRTCKITGNCPDDVVKKIEGDTIADRILKWVAGFLFFGGLGIGSGRGTGGARGYVPLGRGPNVATGGGGTRVLRPSGPVDVIGPTDGIVINATPTDPSVFEPGPGENIELDTFDPTDSISTPVNPATDVPTSGIPTIDVSSTVTEIRPVPPRITSTTEFNNAVFNSNLEPVAEVGRSPFLVDSRVAGSIVGAEPDEIELSEFAQSRFSDVSLEDDVTTSTPKETGRPRRRPYYHRFFKQVFTGSTSFLRPQIGGEYVFENPAFDYDLDMEPIIRRPEQVATRNLGEASFAQGPSGRVRVSRLGQEHGMITRSGQELGQFVHFFTDLSSIHEVNTTELIELSSLRETVTVDANIPTLETIIDSLQTVIDQIGSLQDQMTSVSVDLGYAGIESIDVDEEGSLNFNNSMLRLLDAEPDLDTETGELMSPKKYVAGIDSHSNPDNSLQTETVNIPVRRPLVPLGPSTVIIVSYNYNYPYNDWDPSLRRKRKRTFIF